MSIDANATHDATTEQSQPNNAVAAELEAMQETEAQPQAEDESSQLFDLVVDSADDNANSDENTQKQKAANAYKQRKAKREQKEQEAIAAARAKAEQEKLDIEKQQQDQQLASDIAEWKRGARPVYGDFDSEDEYSEALLAWHNAAPKKVEVKKVTEVDENAIRRQIQIDDVLNHSHENLKKELKSYDSVIEKGNDFINTYGPDGAKIIKSSLAYYATITPDVDPAKIEAVLSIKGAQNDFRQAMDANKFANDYDAIETLKQLQTKYYKLNRPTGASTTPPPEVKQTGSTSTAAVKMAREKWEKDPSAANYRAYSRAKKGN